MNYNALEPFALTDRQRQVLRLRCDGLTYVEIAKITGGHDSNARSMVRKIKARAAAQGYAPENDMTKMAPEGFSVKGVSTMYDADGNVRAQWVKTQAQKQQEEMLLDAITSAIGNYNLGKVKAPRISRSDKDLLTVYPMGDPHIGMYAWSAETGADFDVEIAQSNLTEATSRLVDIAPPSEHALILNLGDFFHADTMDNKTLRSGNALDVDSRWGRVFEIGFQAMVQCIDEARRKHKFVTVKNMIGNHDDHTSQALAFALSAFFNQDKRVKICTSPAKFWYHRFHKVLIGSAHGDTSKPDLLPQIMAADRVSCWGQTEFRYWYTGHIHSQNQKEYPGCIWESFKTLAGKDAWHAAQGYRSGRDMYCILQHREFGEIERHRVDIKMLGAKK